MPGVMIGRGRDTGFVLICLDETKTAKYTQFMPECEAAWLHKQLGVQLGVRQYEKEYSELEDEVLKLRLQLDRLRNRLKKTRRT